MTTLTPGGDRDGRVCAGEWAARAQRGMPHHGDRQLLPGHHQRNDELQSATQTRLPHANSHRFVTSSLMLRPIAHSVSMLYHDSSSTSVSSSSSSSSNNNVQFLYSAFSYICSKR